jgi:hypothetical protein
MDVKRSSKRAHGVFALVISFLGMHWQPKHIAIGLFEASETIGHALARNIIELLNKYGFYKKILCM